MKNSQLQLSLNILEFPQPVIPPNYLIRKGGINDCKDWLSVVNAAFVDSDFNEETFKKELLGAPGYTENLFLFLLDESKVPIATATAVKASSTDPSECELHYVAVHPKHQGKHLGKLLSQELLRRAYAHGYTSAMVHTDDHRIAAIKTYLNLGFIPKINDNDEQERWKRITSILKTV